MMSSTLTSSVIQIWSPGDIESLLEPLRATMEISSKALADVFKRFDSMPTTLIEEMFAFVGAEAGRSQAIYARLSSRWDEFRKEMATSELAWDEGKGPFLMLAPARDDKYGLASATLCSRCQTVQMTITKRNIKFPAEKGIANKQNWFIEFSFDPFDSKHNENYLASLTLLQQAFANSKEITLAHS